MLVLRSLALAVVAVFSFAVHASATCRPGGGFEPALKTGLERIVGSMILKNARDAFGTAALECNPEFEIGWSGKRLEACRVSRLEDAALAATLAEEFYKQVEMETGTNLKVDAAIFSRSLKSLRDAIDDDGDARAETLANFVSETVRVLGADNCPIDKSLAEPELIMKLLRVTPVK